MDDSRNALFMKIDRSADTIMVSPSKVLGIYFRTSRKICRMEGS